MKLIIKPSTINLHGIKRRIKCSRFMISKKGKLVKTSVVNATIDTTASLFVDRFIHHNTNEVEFIENSIETYLTTIAFNFVINSIMTYYNYID